ncbi:hypothetical protein BC943DRAFT_362851 [Umbelopsis sp. AD052]|nr:hypothetical protein BC943DRAFT_362851 [Umbelopsis sp. AD052]
MAKFTQIMVLSIGTLAGAAVGFYALEAYKVKEKEKRLGILLERKRQHEQLLASNPTPSSSSS